MTYAEAVDHLNALVPELAGFNVRRFDLDNMHRLCKALGDQQDRVPSVLIGGTNGKGSTAATLASILVSAGYRVGLYTSPHLSSVCERIQSAHAVFPSEYGATPGAGAPPGAEGKLELGQISTSDFARLYTLVEHAGEALVHAGELPLAPSFFERMTAIAFLYFAEIQADIMVLEVGLGGRLDATNVVDPLLSILTDISLDHQEYLGNTIYEIAIEKCGILRAGGVLVTLPQHPEANQAIGEAAMRLDVKGISAAEYLPQSERNHTADHLHVGLEETRHEPQYHPRQGRPSWNTEPASSQTVTGLAENRYPLPLGGNSIVDIHSPLRGEHQRRNIALAVAAAIALRNEDGYILTKGIRSGYTITDDCIVRGIAATVWPGRLEMLPPNLLLDVAHNPAGAWTLRSALATLPEEQPRTLIFSCLRDKKLAEMARILFPLFDSGSTDPLRRQDHVILAPISSPRAADVQDLLKAAHDLQIPAHAAPHLAAALQQARQITPAGGLIVATGSVYLIGEIRQLILQEGASRTE